MALIFFDGFDGDMVMSEWGSAVGSPATGRDGVANNGRTTNASLSMGLPAAYDTVILGVAFMYSNVNETTSGGTIYGLRNGATDHLVFKVSAAGFLEMRLTSPTGTLLRTGTTPLLVNVWNHFQIKANLHLTAGNVEVRVNGKTEFTYTGQTATATVQVTGLSWTHSAFQNVYDDFWICDGTDGTATQGRSNNDFLGDCKVAPLLPSAAGAVTGWTPSTGANWAAVDEVPPNTTDYVSSVAASAQQDLYAMTDLPVTATTVFAMRPMYWAQKTDAGNAFIKPLIREPDGTVVSQAALALSTSYARAQGATVYKKSGGSVWSPADVNGMQFGQESA